MYRPNQQVRINHRTCEGLTPTRDPKTGDTYVLAKANAAEFPPIILTGEFMIRGTVKKRLEEPLDD